MELGAISSAKGDSSQCASCKGYGHWSLACSTPRNWQRRRSLAKWRAGGNGGKGMSKARTESRSSGQVLSTEADSCDKADKDEESGNVGRG